ncbi:MAG: NAD(P)/FAD-dependent oxidoreductase [Anaerolineaceae bacterium]|nr:NAD(P)/FAD-dependent oxidoreductase [Anaerolineaceae bacterium]
MLRLNEIKLSLDHTDHDLKNALLNRLGIRAEELLRYAVFKRSYDARKRNAIKLIYTVDVEVKGEERILERKLKGPPIRQTPDMTYQFMAKAPDYHFKQPVVIGSGPCGLFAGLLLAQMGFKPLILERGKPVRERTVDTFRFWRESILDTQSNVQFGEGGAGTFSDGKLHTQIKDRRFLGRKVLKEFIKAGAPEEILTISKPHIGTLRLVKVVENLRKTIEKLGGTFRFETQVTDLLIKNGKINGVGLENGEQIDSEYVILAIGHSARDTFEMLHTRGVDMQAKSFSIGLRIEHPQILIDKSRFGSKAGHPLLGAADYKLVHHCKTGRSVYSFCMCPGGTVVAAASEPGTVVTNGMSQYSRNAINANSAMVCEVNPQDYPDGPLAGIAYQREWEKRAFELGGRNYDAPVQLLGDFLKKKPSIKAGKVQPSYQPGVKFGDLSLSLPDYVIASLREALPAFESNIQGFRMPEAVLTGVETRTSSPLRIQRGKDLQSINLQGLYPAGEGAGYAGGILSSAVDGIKAAESVALRIAGESV